MESAVKDAAEISMGTEISDEDILNISYLCTQVCITKLFTTLSCTGFELNFFIHLQIFASAFFSYLQNQFSA